MNRQTFKAYTAKKERIIRRTNFQVYTAENRQILRQTRDEIRKMQIFEHTNFQAYQTKIKTDFKTNVTYTNTKTNKENERTGPNILTNK